MFVLEYKIKASKTQQLKIEEAIGTVQFVRNKCLRFWMNSPREAKPRPTSNAFEVEGGVPSALKCFDLNKYSTQLRTEFEFVKNLNSMAVQASSERAWFAVSRFFDNCKKKSKGKRDIQLSRKTIARLSTKLADGRYIQLQEESLLPIKSGLVKSNFLESGMCILFQLS